MQAVHVTLFLLAEKHLCLPGNCLLKFWHLLRLITCWHEDLQLEGSVFLSSLVGRYQPSVQGMAQDLCDQTNNQLAPGADRPAQCLLPPAKAHTRNSPGRSGGCLVTLPSKCHLRRWYMSGGWWTEGCGGTSESAPKLGACRQARRSPGALQNKTNIDTEDRPAWQGRRRHPRLARTFASPCQPSCAW